MSQKDYFEKDYYGALGVPKDADASTIKKTYRKLASELHPDKNPGDAAAEKRFKEVSEAYAVLGDEKKRAEYDEAQRLAASGFSGAGGFPGGGFPGGAGGYSQSFNPEDLADLFARAGAARGGRGGGYDEGPDLSDLLGGMFGGGARRGGFPGGGGFGGDPGFGQPRASKGADTEASVSLSFDDAVRGVSLPLRMTGPNGTRTITVNVPAGINDGQKFRVKGKGQPGAGGGPAGDLLVKVSVAKHRIFGLDGRNLTVTVPVTYAEATLGANVKVPTLDKPVTLRVPPGSQNGRKLRAKGKGIETKKGTGDLIVTLEVAVPQKLSAEAEEALKKYAELQPENPREHLGV